MSVSLVPRVCNNILGGLDWYLSGSGGPFGQTGRSWAGTPSERFLASIWSDPVGAIIEGFGTITEKPHHFLGIIYLRRINS